MTFRDALTRRWIYTAITVAIGCPDTLEIVRHLGSFGMSCHNLSQALAILTSSETESFYSRIAGSDPV
ncbi:hypothetical protein DS043_05175 [Escherichia coli]|nr:hypothetical protein [Escherichia coli]EFZ0026726.1 hypothetical protein [Shigella dysenteriae]EEW3673067.1 hypothetical protein [Escherichia coli]EEW8345293.1 hypothetical protein [Escherichia coli]EFN9915179.1 hypothetical protein [Escherichia coli]